MTNRQDDDLRDSDYLQSRIYDSSLRQVREAVKFLSREETERLFREVLNPKTLGAVK